VRYGRVKKESKDRRCLREIVSRCSRGEGDEGDEGSEGREGDRLTRASVMPGQPRRLAQAMAQEEINPTCSEAAECQSRRNSWYVRQ
jgi:hypothetical protein